MLKKLGWIFVLVCLVAGSAAAGQKCVKRGQRWVLVPDPAPLGTEGGQPVGVALFQDQAPWGSDQNQRILTETGIPFDLFPSTRMGDPDLDLTVYPRVVIVSQQPDVFWQRVEANRDWFEAYASAGGILELHLANGGGSMVERITLPGGIRVSPTFCSNAVHIVDPEDPIVVGIAEADLQNWNCSSHGALIQFPPDSAVVIQNLQGPAGPATLVAPLDAGAIVATYQPVEFQGNPNTLLLNRNLILLAAAVSLQITDNVQCGEMIDDETGGEYHCVWIGDAAPCIGECKVGDEVNWHHRGPCCTRQNTLIHARCRGTGAVACQRKVFF